MIPSQQLLHNQVRRASTFETAGGDSMIDAPLQTDLQDRGHFMMDNIHSGNPSLIHSPAPSLNGIGSPHFADFSFQYQRVQGHGTDDTLEVENSLDPYSLASNEPPSEHRESISSISGMPRANFGNAVAAGHAGNASISGESESASPISVRAGVLDTGFGDDFGLNNMAPVDGSDLGGRTREEKNDPTPAWSDLKTKAGKDRKRLPLACIACRRKKIRCSGEKPACKHCLRSRIPCVYKVTTRKAAPRTDYMAMLDKRLKRMEERIIKIVPKEEQDSTIVVTRANVKPAIPGTTATKGSSTKKRGADEALGPELDTWSKSVAHPNLDTGSKSSSRLIQEAEESKLLCEGSESLPARDIQEHLSEIFFENLYGQTYHLLHKPSFMRKLKSGTLPPVLVLAVCAISARFSTHPKLNTTPAFLRGEDWASAARDIVMKRYEWPNITILTCLLILGLHEFGTCQGGRSWALGGQAIRMAYALQLHKDLDHDPQGRNGATPLSFIDREIRRRTMWACFLMDRFNSSGTDRPTFIKEENLKIPLPIKEKYFQLDMPGPTENLKGEIHQPVTHGIGELSNPKDNMGVAAHMIRSIVLWGRIINYLNLGGNEEDPHPMWHPESIYTNLIQQTEAFESTLPDSLKYGPENLHTHETEGLANQFLFLHISVQQNILFMNRFAVPGHIGGRLPKDVPKEFVTKAGAKAFEAANRISEIIRDGESFFVTAPFAGYCAFLSSTVHIFGVFSGNSAVETTSKKNLTTNVKYLAKMKRYWGMFHFMSENLKDQYRKYADASRQGASDGSSSTPAAHIFQYGDWFDQYPHGVSQSDFEDPTIIVKKEKGDDAVLEQKSDYHTVEEFFHTMTPSQRQDVARTQKRQSKKHRSMRKENLDAVNTNLPNFQGINTPHLHAHQLTPGGYNQMSPITPVNMYGSQHDFYGHLPPHHQGMLPQLDRQLVFGAYGGLDPSSQMIDPAQWEMQMGGMNGFVGEPSSAWFMPFNMEPPEIGQDGPDIFNTMGGAGYGGNGMG